MSNIVMIITYLCILQSLIVCNKFKNIYSSTDNTNVYITLPQMNNKFRYNGNNGDIYGSGYGGYDGGSSVNGFGSGRGGNGDKDNRVDTASRNTYTGGYGVQGGLGSIGVGTGVASLASNDYKKSII